MQIQKFKQEIQKHGCGEEVLTNVHYQDQIHLKLMGMDD